MNIETQQQQTQQKPKKGRPPVIVKTDEKVELKMGRPSKLTDEERKERKRIVMKNYYEKTKTYKKSISI